MANVIFTKGVYTRQLSAARVWPINDAPSVNVVFSETPAGVTYAYRKGATRKSVTLKFINLSRDDDTWLRYFFESVVGGPLYPFSFTNEDGITEEMRWLDTVYPIEKEESGSVNNRFQGTINLRKEV